MNRKDRQTYYIFFGILAVLVIWAALLFAPYMDEGLPGIIENAAAYDSIFKITWNENSLKTVLIFLGIYSIAVGLFFSTVRNYRRGEEHGSAKWNTPKEMRKHLMNKSSPSANKIMTQNVSVSLNDRKTGINLHTVVIGGSGAGKTRYYVIPNLMQANTSYIVLDPKGELVSSTGNFLRDQGYDVRVLDLVHMKKSNGYNPLWYLKDTENDGQNTEDNVQRLVTNIFLATGETNTTEDPFWPNMAQVLLKAIIFYLLENEEKELWTFETVMFLASCANLPDEGKKEKPPLHWLFEDVKRNNPKSTAVKYYRMYDAGAGKTVMSILATFNSRLEKFNMQSMIKLTSVDEMKLDDVGSKKVALFAVIPENDTSYNFLITVLYLQLFQMISRTADENGGKCPVPVHFLMDEFANVALPPEFENTLQLMRSKGMFVSIILQSITQLEKIFDKSWESIMASCDQTLYLGSNENKCHEYISKRLGKETIYLDTYSKSKGTHGSYSTSNQMTGRELMTPDEVANDLAPDEAILFIRNHGACVDKKFDIMKHKNVRYTTHGGGKPFVYGMRRPLESVRIIREEDLTEEQRAGIIEIRIHDKDTTSNNKNDRRMIRENEK